MSTPTSVPPRPGKGGKKPAPRPTTPTPHFKGRKPELRRSVPTTWLIAGLIAVVILVAGVVAIVSTTGGDGGDDTGAWSQTRPVAVTGTALSPEPDSGDDPVLGTVAPTFSGASFDGDPVSWSPGRATLFVFLAHWCPHCQVEVPLLVAWQQSGQVPEGLDVIGVSTNVTSSRDNYPPSDWLAREGWPWPVVADSEASELAAAMGVATFPNFVLVDASGAVVWRSSGEQPIATLQTQVDAAVAA